MILYWLIVHWALIVTSSSGIVVGIVLFHPANVYPSLVGLAGFVIVVPYASVWAAIGVPPSVSNVNVHSLVFHTATIVTFSAGILVGTTLFHDLNVYQSFSGSAIGVISALYW